MGKENGKNIGVIPTASLLVDGVGLEGSPMDDGLVGEMTEKLPDAKELKELEEELGDGTIGTNSDSDLDEIGDVTDATRMYLREIGRFPLLSSEDERCRGRQMERARLVNRANQGLREVGVFKTPALWRKQELCIPLV